MEGNRRLRRAALGLGALVLCAGSLVLGPGPAAAASVPVTRIYGQDAIGTSIAVSQAEFPAADSADAVVLARSDHFSDALAGGPLAAQVRGPLLITPGADQSSTIDPRVLQEIERVLPVGETVYILGGNLALSPNIDATLQGLGYLTQRIAGSNEYATAVDIAEYMGGPKTVFEATGTSFQDALSAVPAAIATGGAILLTDGPTQAPETAQYLATYPPTTRYAVGGPLAAYGADPGATPVYGQDLYQTSAAVAARFFPSIGVFGAATGTDFPDALSGGVFMGEPETQGPMLLVPPSGALPSATSSYLTSAASFQGYLFGGPLAVGSDVAAELAAAAAGSTPAPSSPSVTRTTLMAGTVGTPYSATLTAAGGTPPYTWSIGSGSLPPGLSLTPGGVISGTPSAQGTFSFSVALTDSTTPSPQRADQALSIAVMGPVSVGVANWSGYAALGGPFTSVTGNFTVPYVTTSAQVADRTDVWVGIGGFESDSVIQAGIEERVDPTNPSLADYYAWWYVLTPPQHLTSGVTITTVQIAPGDQVTVTIGQISGSDWEITLTDDTNGESFTTDQPYTFFGSSAEWIVEAPTVLGIDTTQYYTLAPYSPPVTFSGLGFTGPESGLFNIAMLQSGSQVSTPSSLNGNSFNVAYGGVAPPPP